MSVSGVTSGFVNYFPERIKGNRLWALAVVITVVATSIFLILSYKKRWAHQNPLDTFNKEIVQKRSIFMTSLNKNYKSGTEKIKEILSAYLACARVYMSVQDEMLKTSINTVPVISEITPLLRKIIEDGLKNDTFKFNKLHLSKDDYIWFVDNPIADLTFNALNKAYLEGNFHNMHSKIIELISDRRKCENVAIQMGDKEAAHQHLKNFVCVLLFLKLSQRKEFNLDNLKPLIVAANSMETFLEDKGKN